MATLQKLKQQLSVRPKSSSILPKTTVTTGNNKVSTEIGGLVGRERSYINDRIRPGTIIELNYKVLSDKDIISTSVVEITNSSNIGPGSVNDVKMGPSIHGICETCSNLFKNCTGHYGHINLASPIIHPYFYKMVIKILYSVCWSCSKPLMNHTLLVNNGFDALTGYDRLKKIAEYSKNLYCNESSNDSYTLKCDRNIKIINTKSSNILHTIKYVYKQDKTTEYVLTMNKLMNILNGISHEDAMLLGFSNDMMPINMILTKIVVIPPCLRPATMLYSGEITDSDYTKIYRKLVLANNTYKTAMDNETKLKQLNLIISLYQDLLRGNEQSNGILTGLSGKQGYIRTGGLGKHVGIVGRTVLSGNPDLPFGWLNVPMSMRNNLIYPVYVNSNNIKECQKFLELGYVENIKKSNGQYVLVKNIKQLHVGDIIYRWMIDGDIVIFNRQPTLHRHGLMAFYVKLWDNSTIGLNPIYTTMYNADFDGDEGNLLVPAMAENLIGLIDALGIMHVKNCLLSYTNNIAYGLIQDNVAAFHILSKPTTIVDSDTYITIYNNIKATWLDTLSERLRKYNIPIYSGRALISMLFPSDFFYYNSGVVIKEGILISGELTKSIVGNSSSGFIKYLFLREPQLAYDYIDNATYMTNTYLKSRPITMGIRDCVIFDYKTPIEVANINNNIENLENSLININDVSEKEKISKQIDELKNSLLTEHNHIQNQLNKIKTEVAALEKTKESITNKYERARIEAEIIDKLNIAKTIGANLTNKALAVSNLSLAIKAKVKGNELNVASIAAVIGQIIVSGHRPAYMSSFYPEYTSASTGLISKGFGGTRSIDTGLYEGLNPLEVYFSSTGTREGLAGTSLKTAFVGEISRNLRMIMQNLMKRFDGSVRFSDTTIIEPTYVFDSSYLIPTSLGYPSFIDISNVVLNINGKYGYV